MDTRYDAAQSLPSPALPGTIRGGCVRVLLLFTLSLLCPSLAHCQGNAAEEEKKVGFKIVVPADEITDALTDYERQVERGAWEKAFRNLSLIMEARPSGMLPSQDRPGFLVPASQRIREAQASLPPEGRNAFRIFYDSRAQQLLKKMNSPAARRTGEDVGIAEELFERYFLTSVGDLAADFLGDARFQRGDFVAAEDCWRAIVEHHPNSQLSEPKLLAKRAVALHRAGDKEGYLRVLQTAKKRFPNREVRLGGKATDLVGYLRSLAQPTDSISPPASERQPRILPATNAEPAWQMRFLSQAAAGKLFARNNDFWWGNRPEFKSYVPATVAYESNLYCNWLGACFALDTVTGKVLWRTGNLNKIWPAIKNSHQDPLFRRYDIAASKTAIFAITRRSNELFPLAAFNSANGSRLWSSAEIKALEKASFAGRPVHYEDTLYAMAHERGSTKLDLHALEPATGQKLWSLRIGEALHNYSSLPVPTPILQGTALYLLSNNGALIKIDLPTRSLQWAFTFQAPLGTGVNNNRWSPGRQAQRELPRGSFAFQDQTLYFKEAAGPMVYALDLAAGKLRWKRPFADEASVVGVDDELLYLLSKEMVALNRRTSGLSWSVALPVQPGALSALVGSESAAIFTSRGIYEVSNQNGDIQQIFRGHDINSNGGTIQRLGNLTICTSNQAITAYNNP